MELGGGRLGSLHTCALEEETKIYFVLSEADSPNGTEIDTAQAGLQPGFGNSSQP